MIFFVYCDWRIPHINPLQSVSSFFRSFLSILCSLYLILFLLFSYPFSVCLLLTSYCLFLTHYILLLFSVFRYDKISQLEDSDNKNTHTGNGYGHDNKGAIGIGTGTGNGNGNGNGNGTERDKNHMEERKNSFLSQSENKGTESKSPSSRITTHRGADGIAMKNYNIQPTVTTPLTGKRNLSPGSGQTIRSYGSSKWKNKWTKK